jgi:hypothetical protein
MRPVNRLAKYGPARLDWAIGRHRAAPLGAGAGLRASGFAPSGGASTHAQRRRFDSRIGRQAAPVTVATTPDRQRCSPKRELTPDGPARAGRYGFLAAAALTADEALAAAGASSAGFAAWTASSGPPRYSEVGMAPSCCILSHPASATDVSRQANARCRRAHRAARRDARR